MGNQTQHDVSYKICTVASSIKGEVSLMVLTPRLMGKDGW